MADDNKKLIDQSLIWTGYFESVLRMLTTSTTSSYSTRPTPSSCSTRPTFRSSSSRRSSQTCTSSRRCSRSSLLETSSSTYWESGTNIFLRPTITFLYVQSKDVNLLFDFWPSAHQTNYIWNIASALAHHNKPTWHFSYHTTFHATLDIVYY